MRTEEEIRADIFSYSEMDIANMNEKEFVKWEEKMRALELELKNAIEVREAEKANEPDAIEERKRKKEEWQIRNLQNSGIGKRYQNVTINSYKCDTPEQKNALNTIKQFITNPYGKSLLLVGNPGNGKTMLCAIICRYLGAKYIKSSELKDELDYARSFNSKLNPSKVIKKYAKTPVLIIDEVGAYQSPGESEYLFRLLNERYEEELPTVFVSNLSKKEFAKYLGKLIIDRLSETCKSIEFDWESYRPNHKDEWSGNISEELFE
mgnify:CR=1 FL=1